MLSIKQYIECCRGSLKRAIPANPTYPEKVCRDKVFTVVDGGCVFSEEEVADECVVFCLKVIEELKEVRLSKEKTQEVLDCLLWCFPIKKDTTLDGWNNRRLYFVELLRNKGLTDEEIVERVNALPVCCAAVFEDFLFCYLKTNYTFRYAYNHLCIGRNGRDYTVYEIDVDEVKLKGLIFEEEEKQKEQKPFAGVSFRLKNEYRKHEEAFVERLYSLLSVQFLAEETRMEDFKKVLLARASNRETGRLVWVCNTQDVYYFTKQLMGYINGLTFERFGKLCISKCGKGLKNLKASRTDLPRHKQEIDAIFKELNAWIENN